MTSNKYYRDLNDNPFPERRIHEELFNVGNTQDGNPGLQQAVHNLISDLLPQYAIVSGCEVSYDTDFTVNSGYLLIEGNLIEYTGQTFTPTGIGCYVYMTTGGTFFISESDNYVSNNIPIAVSSHEGLITYYKRGYSSIENILMDHDPALFKVFNNIYVLESLVVTGTNTDSVFLRNGRIYLGNSYIRQSAEGVLYTHGSFITKENSIISGNLNVEGNTVLGNASSDILTINPETITMGQNIHYSTNGTSRIVYIYNATGWDSWTPTAGDKVFLIGAWTDGASKTASVDNINIVGNGVCSVATVIITGNNIIIDNVVISGVDGIGITLTGNYCKIVNCTSGGRITITGSYFIISGCNINLTSYSGTYNYGISIVGGTYGRMNSNYISISINNLSTEYGIRLDDTSNYNTIIGNTIIIALTNIIQPDGSVTVGIGIHSGNYNTVVGNICNITNNSDGIGTEAYGVKLRDNDYNNVSANVLIVSGADINTDVEDTGTGNVVDGTNA